MKVRIPGIGIELVRLRRRTSKYRANRDLLLLGELKKSIRMSVLGALNPN